MKKQPIDSLTKQDRYNIRKYIYLYTNCNCGPLDIVLGEWNQAKKKLYHAFGNQLRVKKKIKIEKDNNSLSRELSNIYIPLHFYSNNDLTFQKNQVLNSKVLNSNFYYDFFLYVADYPNMSNEEKIKIMSMFKYKYIISGYLDINLKLEHYKFSVRKGAKTIRTIQKCIKALGYDNIELFNQWRNDINTINSNQLNEATLVLSINPIDFMTMSDNSCNWTSCMSWTSPGCHSAGTIEMMNSNLAVVAYLEPKKEFEIVLDENNKLIMPNKTWRSLLFCHKQIIIAGKSYPYYKKDISIAALDFMREIVENKFGWHYQFKNQLYKDVINFHGNYFLKNYCVPNYHGSKKIVAYTNGMYNDIIEDTDQEYWCCRNKTKGLKLNLSGKNTCVCCGVEILPDDYDYDDEYLGSEKICDDCSDNKCPICNIIQYKTDNKYNLCSDDCKKEAIVVDMGQKFIISRLDFLSKSEQKFFIFYRNEEIIESLKEKIKTDPFFFNRSYLEDEQLFRGKDYVIIKVPTSLIKKNLFMRNVCYSFKSVCNTTYNDVFLIHFPEIKQKQRRISYINYSARVRNGEKMFFKLRDLKYYKYNQIEGRNNETSNSLIYEY